MIQLNILRAVEPLAENARGHNVSLLEAKAWTRDKPERIVSWQWSNQEADQSTSERKSTGSALSLIAVLLLLVSTPRAADAKIGEPIANFQMRYKSLLKLRASQAPGATQAHGTSSGKEVRNFQFALLIEDSERQAAPGFGGGVTVTVKEGKIAGESIAFTLGQDHFVGGQLASSYGLKLANDAIGRTVPGDKIKEDREQEIFSRTSSIALAGSPQVISYPGYENRIILSRSDEGNLLIAILKEDTESGAKPPDGAKAGSSQSAQKNTVSQPASGTVSGITPNQKAAGSQTLQSSETTSLNQKTTGTEQGRKATGTEPGHKATGATPPGSVPQSNQKNAQQQGSSSPYCEEPR